MLAWRDLPYTSSAWLLESMRVKSTVLDDYLPEPGALKNNETGSEELQHDIVPKDHLYEDAEGPSEHGAQQE